MNSSIIETNYCLGGGITSSGVQGVELKNVSFNGNFGVRMANFENCSEVKLSGVSVENNNNEDDIMEWRESYAGTAFVFKAVSSVQIKNSMFVNGYGSVLPTVLDFQDSDETSGLTTTEYTVLNSTFIGNTFNLSDSSFTGKDQGCCINSASAGSLTVENCIFQSNVFIIPSDPIKGGPAINLKNEASVLQIKSSLFRSNQANFQSNAIYFQGFNFSLLNSIFAYNVEANQINVKLAGGVLIVFTYARIFNTSFQGNRGYNGAVSISQGPFLFQILNISLCNFTENWVSYTGAGINIDETGLNRTVKIEDSVFQSNYADNYAAAVFIFGAGVTLFSQISFINCIFADNSAVWEGGAFSIWLYYPFYNIIFEGCLFNGSKVIGSGNSIMGACLDFWGDSSWIKTSELSMIKTSNCKFVNSFSFTGSGLYIVSAIYYDFNSSFESNYAAKEGGTILLSDNSQIFLNFTRINASQSTYSAGCIGGKEQVKLYLNNVLIMNSQSKSGAGIYLDSNSLIFGDNLTFLGNEGEVGSAILIRNTNSLVNYVNNSIFKGNTGSYSAVQVEYATLYMSNASFENSSIAAFSSYSSSLFLEFFNFRDCQCPDQITGCSLFIRQSSSVLLSHSTFFNISGVSVGAIYVELSDLMVLNSSFEACASEIEGDVIAAQSAMNITLNSIIVRSFKTTTLNFQYSGVYINGSLFINQEKAVQVSGGVVYCSDCLALSINNSNFLMVNSSFKGAALFLENYDGDILVQQTTIIENCTFSNLSALYGGAFFLQNSNISLMKSSFFFNTASDGGAIYYSCLDTYYEDCLLNMYNNTFTYNKASVDGGAVKWTGKKPVNITKNIFKNNWAHYGSALASFPVRLGLKVQQTSNNQTIYDTILNSSQPVSLRNVTSGGKLSETLIFYFLDENDEKIDTITLDYLKIDLFTGTVPQPFTEASFINQEWDPFYTGTSSLIFGETFQAIDPNSSTFLISDLSVIGTPTLTVYLQITTMYTSIDARFKSALYAENPHDLYNSTTGSYYFLLPIILKECVSGEIYNISDNKCTDCIAGKFSFSPKDPENPKIPSQCLPCIPKAYCLGGSKIEIQEGYWRKDYFSTSLYQCNLNSESCLGGLNSLCKSDYSGALCEACSSSSNQTFSKNFLDVCQVCPHWGIGLFIEVVLLALIISLVMLCYQIYRLEKFRSKQIRFLVRLLINYFQFIYVSGVFNVQLPLAIKGYITIFELYTLLTRNWINSSCLSTQMQLSDNPQFHHAIAGYFFIFLTFVCCFLIWRGHFYQNPNPDSSRSQKAELCITICYLLNGPLVFLALHAFKCIEIDGQSFLESSPDYECYGMEHILVLVFICLPILLLFLVIYPLFIHILYLRNGVKNLPFKYRKIWNIGCIKDSKKIFFDFFMLFVRYILIGVIVFLDRNDIKKPITCFFIILSFTKAIIIIKPFKYKFFTRFAVLAFIGVSSIYLALILYFSDSSSPKTRLAFVSLTLFINTFFIGNVIYFIATSQNKKKLMRKESILDISYELRFKAFKTFGSVDNKRDFSPRNNKSGVSPININIFEVRTRKESPKF